MNQHPLTLLVVRMENAFVTLLAITFFSSLSKTLRTVLVINWTLCFAIVLAETINNLSTLSPDEVSFPTDHHLIEFTIQLKFKRAKPVRRNVYDYNRANFSELRRALSRVPLDIIISHGQH